MASRPQTTTGGPRLVEISLAISLATIVMLVGLLAKCSKPANLLVSGPPVQCNSAFLGPNDFEGDWKAEPPLGFLLGGSSVFSGKIFLANIDRKMVEDVLPVNWTLAKPTNSSEPCHPILILFGDHTDTRAIIAGKEYDVGGDDDAYQEMMLLVPFTQRDYAGPLWHTAVIRMYLDDPLATQLGNDYYAYAKVLATLTRTATSIDVNVGGLAAFQATTSAPGPWQNVSASTIVTLDEIQDILAMPLFGVVKSSAAVGGEYDVCSYFEMRYALGTGTESMVRTLSVQHDYFIPFVPAMASWVGLPVLGNSMDGAIEIKNLSWRLKFPANSYCQYSP